MHSISWRLFLCQDNRANYYCKIHSSDLDALKELAVESIKDYIERSGFSYGVKESMKKNYEHLTDMTLHGIKQRLHESKKLFE